MKEAVPWGEGEAAVVVAAETTLMEERGNNGEFNMAPRGSFNHLIESLACLGFPLRFVRTLPCSRSHLGDEYLQKGRAIT